MTWTYGGDPSANDRDWIRFRVGDTDINFQEVTDEEIAAMLTEEDNRTLAAAAVARFLWAKYARLANFTVGKVSEQRGEIAKRYQELAQQLEDEADDAAILAAKPSFGGQSYDEKETLRDDDDAVQPSFSRGMDDHPGAPGEGDVWDPRFSPNW